MNRDQKAAAIAEIAEDLRGAEAVYAIDYRGITVTQAGELRSRLRDADATFRVVKNTLTERAADDAGFDGLKPVLTGPTALTFVRGDAATAAKVLRGMQREVPDALAFKGGLLNGDTLTGAQIEDIARLPAREQLIAQFAGIVASPITGVVRTLGALIGGLAVALGQVQEKKESGEIGVGGPDSEPPAATTEPSPEPAPATDTDTDTDAGDQDAEPPVTTDPTTTDAPAEGADDKTTEPATGGE
jgi:large subunit ribosomal protein L10